MRLSTLPAAWMSARRGWLGLVAALGGTVACAPMDSPLAPDGTPPATRIVLTPVGPLYAVGATQSLQATARDLNGNPVAGVALSYTSSAPSVAMVDGAGLVTATGHGSAVITVTGAGLSTTTTVTVSARLVATVRVSGVDQPDKDASNDTATVVLTATVQR